MSIAKTIVCYNSANPVQGNSVQSKCSRGPAVIDLAARAARLHPLPDAGHERGLNVGRLVPTYRAPGNATIFKTPCRAALSLTGVFSSRSKPINAFLSRIISFYIVYVLVATLPSLLFPFFVIKTSSCLHSHVCHNLAPEEIHI